MVLTIDFLFQTFHICFQTNQNNMLSSSTNMHTYRILSFVHVLIINISANTWNEKRPKLIRLVRETYDKESMHLHPRHGHTVCIILSNRVTNG